MTLSTKPVLLTLLCLAFFGQARGASPNYAWVTAAESGLDTQNWILSSDPDYYPNYERLRQFVTATQAGTNITSTINLNRIVPPGTYRMWLASAQLAGSGTNMMIGFPSIGDTSIPDYEFSTIILTNLGTFTSGVAFSNLTMKITKLTAAGTPQSYFFSALGVLPLNYGQIERNDTFFVDYTTPNTTNTDFKAGNLIPNGDFEHRMNGGWCYTRSSIPYHSGGTNFATWINDAIVGDASHGNRSLKMSVSNAFFQVYSPAINVRGGIIGNYTLSFDAKGDGFAPLTVIWGPVFAQTNSYVTNLTTSWVFTPTTSWARYSTNFNFDPRPTAQFMTDFVNGGTNLWIDQVQLVEGTSTNFLANNPLSLGLTLNRNGNLINTNAPRIITFELQNNSGITTNINVDYEVFDWMNHTLVTGSSNYTLPAGFTTTNLNLATTNNGTTRVMAWIREYSAHRDEMVFSVIPMPLAPVLQSNSLFGIHGNYQRDAGASNILWGFPPFDRSLSPAQIARRGTIQPATNTWVWTGMDNAINAITNNKIVFLSLNEHAYDPAWTKTNGFPMIDVLTNYVQEVVLRTKDRVQHYESENEPNGGGSGKTPWTVIQYTAILEAEANAVKAACPTCHFTAFALGVTDGAFLTNVWNGLSGTAKANIDAISAHYYPSPGTDFNGNDGGGADNGRFAIAATWSVFTGKPIMQTESGYWNLGARKGDAIGGKSFAAGVYPSDNEEKFTKGTILAAEIVMRNILNALGVGFARYYYYDGRQSDANQRQGDNQPSIWNIGYDTLTPTGAAIIWAKRFCDTPTNGVFHLTNGALKGFLFARANELVLATYSLTRSNYTMTLTNGMFEVLDLHGNRLSTNSTTQLVGRTPVYWRTTVLTTNQMIDTFTSATVNLSSDTIAPALTVDVTPWGIPNERLLPLRFRWTAADDFKLNTANNNTNVVTRFRFPGYVDTFTEWSAERITTLTNIPSRTRIEVQASDAFGNLSGSVFGPFFGELSISNYLHVSGTARIGTMVVP